jgi:hypothetical protein
MVYRLSLATKPKWNTLRKKFVMPDEDGNYPSGSIYTAQIAEGSITIREVGNVPIAATYDEEGEILTEASFNEDFAVDIVSDYELPVDDYIIENKQWYNEWV